METVWIFKHGTGRPFAFSPDGKSWFTRDGEPWAFAGGDSGWLFAFGSGKGLGFFSGNNFFSPEGKPLYFKSP